MDANEKNARALLRRGRCARNAHYLVDHFDDLPYGVAAQLVAECLPLGAKPDREAGISEVLERCGYEATKELVSDLRMTLQYSWEAYPLR